MVNDSSARVIPQRPVRPSAGRNTLPVNTDVVGVRKPLNRPPVTPQVSSDSGDVYVSRRERRIAENNEKSLPSKNQKEFPEQNSVPAPSRKQVELHPPTEPVTIVDDSEHGISNEVPVTDSSIQIVHESRMEYLDDKHISSLLGIPIPGKTHRDKILRGKARQMVKSVCSGGLIDPDNENVLLTLARNSSLF